MRGHMQAHHIAFITRVGQGDVVNLNLSGDVLDGLGIVRGEDRQIPLRRSSSPSEVTLQYVLPQSMATGHVRWTASPLTPHQCSQPCHSIYNHLVIIGRGL